MALKLIQIVSESKSKSIFRQSSVNHSYIIIIDFFERRLNTDTAIYWPTEEIVDRIQELGCHVVPKPSKKTLSSFQKGTQRHFPY